MPADDESPLSSLVTQVSQSAVPTRPIRAKTKSTKPSAKSKTKTDTKPGDKVKSDNESSSPPEPASSQPASADNAEPSTSPSRASSTLAAERQARPDDPSPRQVHTDDTGAQADGDTKPTIPHVHKQTNARIHRTHIGLGSASDAAIFESKQAAAHDALLSSESHEGGSQDHHRRSREPSPPRSPRGQTKALEGESSPPSQKDDEDNDDWSAASGRHPVPIRRRVSDPKAGTRGKSDDDEDEDDVQAAPTSTTVPPVSAAAATTTAPPPPPAHMPKPPSRSGSILRSLLNKAFHSSQTSVDSASSQKQRPSVESKTTAVTPASPAADDATLTSPQKSVESTDSAETKPKPLSQNAAAPGAPTSPQQPSNGRSTRLKSRRKRSIPPGSRPPVLDSVKEPNAESGGWLCGLGVGRGKDPEEGRKSGWFGKSKKKSRSSAADARANGQPQKSKRTGDQGAQATVASKRQPNSRSAPSDSHLAPPSTPRKATSHSKSSRSKSGGHSRSGSASPLRSRRPLPGATGESPPGSLPGTPGGIPAGGDGETSETGLTSSAVVTPGSGKPGVGVGGRVEQETLPEIAGELDQSAADTPRKRNRLSTSSSLSSTSSTSSKARKRDSHLVADHGATAGEGEGTGGSDEMAVDDADAPASATDGSEEDDDEESTESARLIARGGMGIPIGPDGKPKPLLPVLGAQDQGRKCLVLDLDETLVHSSVKPMAHDADFVIPIEIDSQMYNFYVLKRPGVDTFLREMGKVYEIVVFTASLAKYADRVLDRLDLDHVVRHRLFRESCFKYKDNYIKDLSQLGRPIEDTIIIDNSPTCYILQPNNAVPIGSWFSDNHDTELLDLVPFLEDLATVDDVRDVLELTSAY